MSEEINRIKVVEADELFADLRNAIHPFTKDVIILAHRYIVGTDFTSGNNLRLDIDGAQQILFAAAKTPSGTLLTIAETDLATETSDTTRQGLSLTFGTSTTDIEIFIIYKV